MTIKSKIETLVTVFGGSGFLGRHVVRALANRGYRIRVAVRRPELAGYLQPMGRVGQIHAVRANLRYPDLVTAALRDADVAINLVGLMLESGRQRFDAVMTEGAETVAKAASAIGAPLVHISSLAADPNSTSRYARTKGEGEARVRAAQSAAIIVRPSIVFGPEDDFFNRFASMSRLAPALPLVGGGHTRMQPVFAGDVADGIARAVDGALKPGTTYEFGGPDAYTFKALMEFVARHRRASPPAVADPVRADEGCKPRCCSSCRSRRSRPTRWNCCVTIMWCPTTPSVTAARSKVSGSFRNRSRRWCRPICGGSARPDSSSSRTRSDPRATLFLQAAAPQRRREEIASKFLTDFAQAPPVGEPDGISPLLTLHRVSGKARDDMLTLFHHPICPHSRFVRLILEEYNQPPRLVEERVWERRPEFLELNPAGTTPVLVEEGAPPVPGSAVIAEYVDEAIGTTFANGRLLPLDANPRIEVRRLMNWFNEKFFAEVSGPW